MKIVYVCFGLAIGTKVIESQVIDLLRLLSDRGIDTHLVTFDGIVNTRRNWKLFRSRLADARDSTGNRPFSIVLPRLGSPLSPLGICLSSLILLLFCIPFLLTKERLVIHSRGSRGVLASQLIKRLFPSVQVIFDVRGALVEEYIYGLERQGVDVNSSRVQTKANRMRKQEKEAVAIADRIICVSNGLKRYLQQLADVTDKQIWVIPSVADSRVFHFNGDVRENVRQELGVSDKTVITYCGSFADGWQVPEKLVNLVLALKKTILDKPFFLVLTPDDDAARRYLVDKMGPEEHNILNVDHDHVAMYLMASDVGLLLRERHVLNQVASPTKFAEYLMCGLPVIVSRGIGDTSEFVERLGGGVVLDGLGVQQKDIDNIAKLIYASREQAFRRGLALAAANLLSRQSQLNELLRIYGEERG